MNMSENGMRVTLLAIVLLLVPTVGWGQTGHPKSPDEILDGLLGGERAPGGLRPELDGSKPGASQGRIALPIQFEYNSARISDDSVEQLRSVAQALKDPRLQARRIRIEGHTDNKGSHEYNQELSQARATAVERYLVDKAGVDAKRLEAKGYAESRPLPGISQDTDDGRAANRRVEFVNLGAVPAAEAVGRRMSVDVLVNYKSGGQVHRVSPGTVLRTKDNYRVSFTPARDGYVYVYQVDASGNATSVYPNPSHSSASNPVKAKRHYTVPEGKEWLLLSENVGNEEIVVLGTERELSDPKAVVLRMRSEERGPGGTRPDLVTDTPEDLFTYRLPFQHQ